MLITADKISKGSFFKLLLISIGCSFFFLFLICGIAAIFGFQTIAVNGEYVTGFKGMIAAIFMWPLFSLIFSGTLWFFGILGLWVYSFIKPLNIQFKGEVTTHESTVSDTKT